MLLAHPERLWWALAVAPVALAFLSWRRGGLERVATLTWWREAFARRRWWTTYGRSVSLLLYATAILLLVLAAAEPYLPADDDEPRHFVMVLDCSASMNAPLEGATRLARAVAAARRLMDQLGSRDRVAIVHGGASPRLACGLSADRSVWRQALDAVRSTDEPGAATGGVELARQLLHGRGGGHIVLFTDRPRGAFPPAKQPAASGTAAANTAAAEGSASEFHQFLFGRDVANAAVTRLVAQARPGQPHRHDVLVEIRRFGSDSTPRQLRLELAGREIAAIPLGETSEKTITRVLQFESPSGGLLSARLDPTDAFATDDARFTLVAGGRPPQIRVLGEPGPAVSRVLPALSTPEPAAADAATGRAESAPTLTVVVGKPPVRLPSGPLIVLSPRASCDAWKFVADEPARGAARPRVAALQAAGLEDVAFETVTRLDLVGRSLVLAETESGQPLVSKLHRAEGDIWILHADLAKSDLPLHAAFPRLMSRAVADLTAPPIEPSLALATGDVIRPAAGDRQPPTSAASKPPRAAIADQAGIWTLTSTDELRRPAETAASPREGEAGAAPVAAIPVNITGDNEYDLGQREAAANPSLDAFRRGEDRRLWAWFAAAGLLVLAGEWWLFEQGTVH